MKEYKYALNKSQSLLIDLIRTLSAQGVLVGHLLFWQGFLSKEKYHFLYRLASYCVLIFFILSGFLICLSIANKKEYSFKSFFIDRFSRIYTAYIPALLLVFIMDYIISKITNQSFLVGLYVKEFIGNLFMLQEFPLFELLQRLTSNNIFYLPYLGTDLPLWTLSVEWWLYMLFGWIILAKKKNGQWLILLIFFSIVPLYQLFIGSHMGAGITIYWFLGSLFPILLTAFKIKQINHSLLAIVLLLAGGLGFIYNFFVGAFTFMLGFFLLLKYYEQHKIKLPVFLKKGTKIFANFSFSLYLIHYTLITFLLTIIPKLNSLSVSIKLLIIFGIVNLCALIFAYFTEFRYQNVKKYLKEKLLL